MPEGFAIALQIPSQLVAERVGLPYWLGFLMVGWGITATLMAGLTSNPVHLYLLRFFLGKPWDSCGISWSTVTMRAWGFSCAQRPCISAAGPGFAWTHLSQSPDETSII
jgi:hypothetical protein